MLNIGKMTGKGKELAYIMKRSKVDILCAQKTRWNGSEAYSIGVGFKLFIMVWLRRGMKWK